MSNNYVVRLKLNNTTHYNTEATFQYKETIHEKDTANTAYLDLTM